MATKELASVRIPFERPDDLFFIRKWLFVLNGKEYATKNKFRYFFLDWAKIWFPAWQELMDIDLTKTLTVVKCPVCFFVGKDDIQTSTQITTTYFNEIKAPEKELYLFEFSKHEIQETEPEKYQNIIIEDILAKNKSE
ncbi:hypothetical protein [Flavobacterium sp. KACC 22761]|uniref:hypothetical protein n=1 Tax=Flavobacterium sp. KACC 22761 TaxID=3092665 RepID=UPI002A74E172|nr:hypothetical protein [Flavobacterium sp. KACC 22761]WPO78358.1 hypothetical protein SCB73_19045 [Flavobacterium sp. KACC 22761]